MLHKIRKLINWRRQDHAAVELSRLEGEIRLMANELAGLSAQIATTSDVLGQLVAKVNAGGIDPAAVAAATLALKTATDSAAAVLQPVTPAPAPVEPAPAPDASSPPAAAPTA